MYYFNYSKFEELLFNQNRILFVARHNIFSLSELLIPFFAFGGVSTITFSVFFVVVVAPKIEVTFL